MPAPRVLVADDNPLSLRFLADASKSAGWLVSVAADGAEAVAIADETACDLLLLDLRMPRVGGIQALARIRDGGASRHAVALATTAAVASDADDAVREAGFASILRKPLTVAALHSALAQHLPGAAFDDAKALSAAGGDLAIVAALRRLLAAELQALPDEIARYAAARDAAALHDRLHRLDASCGFCGVPALADAARHLRAALAGGGWPPPAFERFLRECASVRERLRPISS